MNCEGRHKIYHHDGYTKLAQHVENYKEMMRKIFQYEMINIYEYSYLRVQVSVSNTELPCVQFGRASLSRYNTHVYHISTNTHTHRYSTHRYSYMLAVKSGNKRNRTFQRFEFVKGYFSHYNKK